MRDWPALGVCEIANLKEAMLQPVRDVAAWVRQHYIDAPVSSQDPVVVAFVRQLRGQVFDRMIERFTP